MCHLLLSNLFALLLRGGWEGNEGRQSQHLLGIDWHVVAKIASVNHP